MESEPILSLCSYSRYACGHLMKRHGSFLTLIICPAQDSDLRTMPLPSHCQPGPPLILPCCPMPTPKVISAQNLNHNPFHKNAPFCSVAMCPVLLLSNLDSICSAINTSLSWRQTFQKPRWDEDKRDWFSLPWGKLFSHSGQRAPPYRRSCMGLTKWPVLELKRREKEQAVDIPLTYSIWGHRRCTKPLMKGSIDSYHWVNRKVSETQAFKRQEGKVDAFPAN